MTRRTSFAITAALALLALAVRLPARRAAEGAVDGGHRRGGGEPRPADEHAVHVGDLPAAHLRYAGRDRGRRAEAGGPARRAMGDGQPDDVAVSPPQEREVPQRQGARRAGREVLVRAVRRHQEPPVRLRARHPARGRARRRHRGDRHRGAQASALQSDRLQILPRDARERAAPRLHDSRGTGPYRLVEWRRDQQLVLEANPTSGVVP